MARPLILQDEAIAGGLQRDAAGETKALSFRDLNNFDIVFDPVVSLRRRAGFANYASDTNSFTNGIRQVYGTTLPVVGGEGTQDVLLIVDLHGTIFKKIENGTPSTIYTDARGSGVPATEVIEFQTVKSQVYISKYTSGTKTAGNQGYMVYDHGAPSTLNPATLVPYNTSDLGIHRATAIAPMVSEPASSVVINQSTTPPSITTNNTYAQTFLSTAGTFPNVEFRPEWIGLGIDGNGADVERDTSNGGSLLTSRYTKLAQKIARPHLIMNSDGTHPYTGNVAGSTDTKRVNTLFDSCHLFVFLAGWVHTGSGGSGSDLAYDSNRTIHASGNLRVKILTNSSNAIGGAEELAVSNWVPVHDILTSYDIQDPYRQASNPATNVAWRDFMDGTPTTDIPPLMSAANMYGTEFFWGNNSGANSTNVANNVYYTQFLFTKSYELATDDAWIVLEGDDGYYTTYNSRHPVCWPCFKNLGYDTATGTTIDSKLYYGESFGTNGFNPTSTRYGTLSWDEDPSGWGNETPEETRLFELGYSNSYPHKLINRSGPEYYTVPYGKNLDNDTIESDIDTTSTKAWLTPGSTEGVLNSVKLTANFHPTTTVDWVTTTIPVIYPDKGTGGQNSIPMADTRETNISIYRSPVTINWAYPLTSSTTGARLEITSGVSNTVHTGLTTRATWGDAAGTGGTGIADATLPTPVAGLKHSGTTELVDTDDRYFQPTAIALWRDRVWLADGRHLRYSQRLESNSVVGVVGDPVWDSFPILNLWSFDQKIKGLDNYSDRLVIYFKDSIKVLSGGDSTLNPASDLMVSDLSGSEGLIDGRVSTEVKGMLTFINQYKQVKGFVGREDTMDLSEPNQSIWETFGSKFKSVVYNEQLVIAVDTDDDGDYEELHILDTSRARAFWRKYTYSPALKDIGVIGTQLIAAQGTKVIVLAGYPSSNTASEGTFSALAETHPVVSPTRSRWVGFNIDAYYGSATPPAVTMTGIAKDGTTSVNTFTAQNSNDVRAHSGGLRVLSEECRLKLESTGEAADEIRMVTLR